MDGNGRWAKAQNKPRSFGHKRGFETLKKLVDDVVVQQLPIKWISFFAFSIENWSRPKTEVSFLMRLFESSLNKKLINSLNQKNIKFVWIGFKDRLSKSLILKINNVVNATKNNTGLVLNIVFNYSGKADIEHCLKNKKMISNNVPDIDLLIRTSGEKRISNFLLCQLAYSEIIFEKALWPDYNINTLKNNIKEFIKRDRRFGGVK